MHLFRQGSIGKHRQLFEFVFKSVLKFMLMRGGASDIFHIIVKKGGALDNF